MMVYPNYFNNYPQNQFNGMPQQNPFQGQVQCNQFQQFQQPEPKAVNCITVQGIGGAEAYPVAPGNEVRLWDSTAPVIYIKTVDFNGNVLPLTIIDYTIRNAQSAQQQSVQQQPVQQPQIDMSGYVRRDEFDELVKRVSELKEAPVVAKRGVKNES